MGFESFNLNKLVLDHHKGKMELASIMLNDTEELKRVFPNTDLEEDTELVLWAMGVKAQRCSRCKYWVEKNDGCNHMTCRCGYEFCYICGDKYRECEHTNN